MEGVVFPLVTIHYICAEVVSVSKGTDSTEEPNTYHIRSLATIQEDVVPVHMEPCGEIFMIFDFVECKFCTDVKVSRECFPRSLISLEEVGDTNFINVINLISCRQRMDVAVVPHGENLQLRVDGL